LTTDKSGFSPLIRERVLSFLKEADVIVVVFDGRAGLMAEDKNAYLVAVESGLPFICVVNKVDRHQEQEFAS